MARCAGITRSGQRCTHTVKGPSGFCHLHDPDRASERSRNASRGGRSKPNRELRDIKERLSNLADDVLEGNVDRGNAAVAGQLLNTYLRAVAVELKAREQLELVERLEALEQASEQTKGGRKWGA